MSIITRESQHITPDIPSSRPEENAAEWERLTSAVAWAAMPDVEIEPVPDPTVPGAQYRIIHTDRPKNIERPGNPHYEAAKPYMDMASEMASDDSDK